MRKMRDPDELQCKVLIALGFGEMVSLPVSGGDQRSARLAFEAPLLSSERQFVQFRLKHGIVLLIRFENLVALTGRSAISFPS